MWCQSDWGKCRGTAIPHVLSSYLSGSHGGCFHTCAHTHTPIADTRMQPSLPTRSSSLAWTSVALFVQHGEPLDYAAPSRLFFYPTQPPPLKNSWRGFRDTCRGKLVSPLTTYAWWGMFPKSWACKWDDIKGSKLQTSSYLASKARCSTCHCFRNPLVWQQQSKQRRVSQLAASCQRMSDNCIWQQGQDTNPFTGAEMKSSYQFSR